MLEKHFNIKKNIIFCHNFLKIDEHFLKYNAENKLNANIKLIKI